LTSRSFPDILSGMVEVTVEVRPLRYGIRDVAAAEFRPQGGRGKWWK